VPSAGLPQVRSPDGPYRQTPERALPATGWDTGPQRANPPARERERADTRNDAAPGRLRNLLGAARRSFPRWWRGLTPQWPRSWRLGSASEIKLARPPGVCNFAARNCPHPPRKSLSLLVVSNSFAPGLSGRVRETFSGAAKMGVWTAESFHCTPRRRLFPAGRAPRPHSKAPRAPRPS
jgi:hypothetical protein